ncbi:MAG: HupE/UreJ family protein [Gammaproteobacteria bacterium]|nr:HupE/UreJ family protein [Gammaproteobacteria bacterium]
MMKNNFYRTCWVLAVLLWPVSVLAHEIRPAIVTLTFKTDGHYLADISTNMEAVLAGVSPKHADTNESPNARSYNQLRELPSPQLQVRIQEYLKTYLSGINIEFDGVRDFPTLNSMEVPEVGDLQRARISVLHLAGKIPHGAREFRWTYAPEFGASVLRQQREGAAGMDAKWLKEGTRSEPYNLQTGAKEISRAEVMRQYTVLGFTHILPKGLDHILFVLGLFLLSVKWRPLLVQVTSFTVAHTITLGLSIYGIISLSPKIVEPLIAASIVYVAVENMVTTELKPWRPFVVFGFGLLHGLGFAGVLAEIGLPRAEFLTALLTFNLGVELGQLTIITGAFFLIGVWWKDKSWYHARVVRPLSMIIAAIAFYWTLQRIFGW